MKIACKKSCQHFNRYYIVKAVERERWKTFIYNEVINRTKTRMEYL